MPGSFNTACSTIYGGFYEGVGDTDKTWKVPINRVAGYDEKTAKDLVTVAINKRGAPEQKAHGLERTVVRRDFMSLEVTEIILPVSEVESKDEDKTLPENKYFKKTQALGVIKVKPWLPEDPLVEYQELPKDQQEEFEIVLEKVVLQYCFLGMHLEARVHRCDDGLLFIDSVTVSPCFPARYRTY